MEVESVNELSPKAARAQLLGLAVSHLPGLDSEAVNTLVCPALEDSGEEGVQILSIILKHSDEFLSENIDDLLQLLLEVLPFCHFSAMSQASMPLFSFCPHYQECFRAKEK